MKRRNFGRVVAVAVFLATLAVPTSAWAQYPLDVLHEFNGYFASSGPEAPPTEGRNGNLYGTTETGGTRNLGTVYRMTHEGAITVVHSFTGGRDGAMPRSALLEARDGNFYGTADGSTNTESGMAIFGMAIFRISPAGAYAVLNIVPAGYDRSPLVEGNDGNFYGTVSSGGAAGGGIAFRMTPTGAYTVLHEFPNAYGSGTADASGPVGLIRGADGNFYGTTSYGGDITGFGCYCTGNGTVFRMSPTGTVTVIHRFAGGIDGAHPLAGLTQGNDGNFYGTTSTAGAGAGTVFRITPAGTVTTLYAFPLNERSYSFDRVSLIRGADGHFYGTTEYGGTTGAANGTIFRLTLQGNVTVVHRFDTEWDGIRPIGLVQASDGRFYGTTSRGGIADRGTVFAMDPAGATTTLYRFTGSSEGAYPNAPLLQARDGNFYGATYYGGLYDFGTIFRVTPSGDFSTLYTFSGSFDGGHPYTALVQGRDGYLYGITPGQGAYNEGTMFRVALDGTFTILHAFNSVLDGGWPRASTLGADGNFYGITYHGGAAGEGTVFRATPTGQVAVLHAFTGGADGADPSTLIGGSDGSFYGTAGNVAFRVTPSGTFSVVGNLPVLGGYSASLLAQGADGQLYGAALCGGGKLFRMSLSGVVTELAATGTYCTDSAPDPSVSLTAGVDGMIYGTLTGLWGGGFPPGNPTAVVFRINPAGAATVLYESGAPRYPQPFSVIQATDGNLYGTTIRDGPLRSGAIFRLNLHRPLAPTSVTATPAGLNQVTLRWTAAAGATSYIVRRIVPGQAPAVIASGLRTTSLTVPLVASSANVSYTVTAVNADGESVDSAPLTLPWGSPSSRTPTITTVRDYDGDGKADLTVFRSATAQWFTLRSGDNGLDTVSWGAPSLLDRPVPADYDGDGKADVAVYRETTGEWFIHRSSDGALGHATWGAFAFGDLPIPADYDGDGRADFAVFRGTTGEWFIDPSSDDTLMHIAWGAPALGDLPVPADYDGDGRADIAVYRGSTGEWFVHQSSNGAFVQFAWGAPTLGDVPVPADYDGDGRTDAAVYRATTGEWFIAFAAGGTVTDAWGNPALDVPVAADYDGDGRADVAVYRFSTGEWLIDRGGQLQQVAWGAPLLGDAVRKY